MKRRALLISALALAIPGRVRDIALWQGSGLGGALSVRLQGRAADLALLAPRIAAEIAQVEATASLHADSELARLNRLGRLAWPSDGLFQLLTLADKVHHETGGAFDPTVQPLWLALAQGQDPAPARALIGWEKVSISRKEIRLGPSQALTLNGMAQGWAADRVADLVQQHGGDALIDMGELHALGGPWPVTADGPGLHLPIALRQNALAVSSPMATRLGAGGHILGPAGQAPLWQTVAVTAQSAALADALSTAFCLMSRDAIAAALQAFPGTAAELA